MTIYIQDRTVIEDTESSIDLITKGWKLHNHPDRLAYSATPVDFGSLLIQRRRWANGGLIILPKLLRYVFAGPGIRAKLAEAIVRIHYLISPATTSLGMLTVLLLPFEEGLRSIWLPLAAAPYFLLYGRDLVRTGYKWHDLPRVYALNLLLVLVNLGGVLKSLQQVRTGRKTAFGRTPKISSRTGAPPLYVMGVLALLACSIVSAGISFADEQWARFAFSLLNSIAFGYVVLRFIGLRECVEDGLAPWPQIQTTILQALVYQWRQGPDLRSSARSVAECAGAAGRRQPRTCARPTESSPRRRTTPAARHSDIVSSGPHHQLHRLEVRQTSTPFQMSGDACGVFLDTKDGILSRECSLWR